MAEWSVGDLLNVTPAEVGKGEGRPVMNGSLPYPMSTPLEDNIWFRAFAIVSYSLVFIASVLGKYRLVTIIIVSMDAFRVCFRLFGFNPRLPDESVPVTKALKCIEIISKSIETPKSKSPNSLWLLP